MICFVCKRPIEGPDIATRHECHEDDCPNRVSIDGGEPCDCDLPCHEKCCPECEEERFNGEFFFTDKRIPLLEAIEAMPDESGSDDVCDGGYCFI